MGFTPVVWCRVQQALPWEVQPIFVYVMSGQSLFWVWWRAISCVSITLRARSHKWPTFSWCYGISKSSLIFSPEEILVALSYSKILVLPASKDLCAVTGEKLPKACQALYLMLFCNFSEVFFLNFFLAASSYISCLHRHEPFLQNQDRGIKSDSIPSMIVSDHVSQRLLKKYFQWLFSFRFILESALYNILLNPEHCHRASPQGIDGSL